MKKLMITLVLALAFQTAVANDSVTTTKLPKHLEKEIAVDIKERTIYPIIKPGDWVGVKHGAVFTTLVGSQEAPSVVIGFGYDTPQNFIFLTHQDSDKLDLNDAVKQAFANIDALEVSFTPSKALDNKVLTASGLPFSSEALLSKTQMMKAHALLESEEIFVSIARRTGLMAVAKNAPSDILNKFVYLHNHAWNDDSYGNAPIANVLFVLRNGQIVGTIPLNEQ